MKITLIIIAFFVSLTLKAIDSLQLKINSSEVEEIDFKNRAPTSKIQSVFFQERLEILNQKSPMDLSYNDKVYPFIENYLNKNKALISRMLGLSDYYFPIFEQMLDKYGLPLELKYLPIVESALNPKARSSSGASGIWQFMYLTGKQYGLNVTSYIDERQDPIKSTEAACVYFSKLYEIFGDWNLVLAAYNGGPGYIQRKISDNETVDFWKLHNYLRTETKNYIPTFIAVNYAMNYAGLHNINAINPNIIIAKTDTIVLKKQVELQTLIQITCLNKETINYLNPSFKKEVYPIGSAIIVPSETAYDFLLNQHSNYVFIDMVDNKQILINEDRIIYEVKKGDYLGRIAQEHAVRIFEIKEWNNLKNTNLDIGDKLVLFVKKKEPFNISHNTSLTSNKYIVQPGDTLWDIAQKHKGLPVWKIKSLNNLESDHIKPGTILIIPSV